MCRAVEVAACPLNEDATVPRLHKASAAAKRFGISIKRLAEVTSTPEHRSRCA